MRFSEKMTFHVLSFAVFATVESYGRFRELYLCFIYLSLIINRELKLLRATQIIILLHVRIEINPPLESFQAFFSYSSQYHLINLRFSLPAFEVYWSYRRGPRMDAKIFQIRRFSSGNDFQNFKVVPLTHENYPHKLLILDA